jgi:DNA polymerase-4
MNLSTADHAVRWRFLDLNAFFASCEQQEKPALRGKPVIVVRDAGGDLRGDRRQLRGQGVLHQDRPLVREARRLCSDVIPVQADHRLSTEYHERILAAVDTRLPVEKVMSIDEMACRLMGTERQVPAARELALKVKRALREQVGGCLTCSIGLAPNVFLGKVGSDLHKPDVLVVITHDNLPDILFALDLQDIYAIGKRMDRHPASVLPLRRKHGPSAPARAGVAHQGRCQKLFAAPPHQSRRAAARGDYYCRRLGLHLSWVGDLSGFWNEISFNESRDTGFLLACLDRLWTGVPRNKPLSVGVVLLDQVPALQHQLDLFEHHKRRNCRLWSTASTTATGAEPSASAWCRPTCGRSADMPPFTGCRRRGSFSPA